MNLRSWGVSDKDQMTKGNFVEQFECLVCTRVAKNMEMSQIGKKLLVQYFTTRWY